MKMNSKFAMILFLDSLPYFGEWAAHIFFLFLQFNYLAIGGSIHLCLSKISKEKYHSMCHYAIGIPSVNRHLLCVYFVPSPLGIVQWKRQPLPLRNSLSSVGEHRKQTIAIKCDKNWNGENTKCNGKIWAEEGHLTQSWGRIK